MSENPYTPPSSPVRDRDPERTGSTLKAVSFGVLTDLLGTTLGGIVLLVVFSSILVSQGRSPEDIGVVLLNSDAYLFVSFAVGMTFTMLGGYVAARVANHREYRHAAIVGIIMLVFGEIMISTDPSSTPLSIRIIGDLLVIPAALLGAHVRVNTKTRTPVQRP